VKLEQPMTILDVIRDADLLGKSFKRKLFRGDSWHSWRAFLCALFALPFEDEAASTTYKQCTGRTDPPKTPFREGFIIAGRRSGKSFVISAIAVFVAVFMSFADFLSPGETPVIAVIASDRMQAQILLKYIRAFFAGSDILRGMIVSDLKETITLTNGVEITVLTGDFRSVRSRTLVAVLLDELAFYSSDGSASSDVELLAALRPSQVTIPNSILLGISSPYARKGVLYREWQEHFGKNDAPTLIWQAASSVMNPTINSLAIASAFLRDPTSARSEYGGDFRSDLEQLFSAEIVEQRIVSGRHELPPSGADYSAFVDSSGGVSDSMVLCIAHSETRGENGIAVLDLIREITAPFSPEMACREFVEILRKYRISEICGDRYGARWITESFEKLGIAYRPSEKSRSELYLELLPLVMSAQCELLDNRKLVGQLVALERMVGRNRDVVDHPRGAHDDVANCVAGALVNVLADGGGFGWLDFVKSGRAEELSNRQFVRPELNVPQSLVADRAQSDWWEQEKQRMIETGSWRPKR
jgi:hypothetical protein